MMYLIRKRFRDVNIKEVVKRMNQKCIDKGRALKMRRNIQQIDDGSGANSVQGTNRIEDPPVDEGDDPVLS